jgi:hypothetical protein
MTRRWVFNNMTHASNVSSLRRPRTSVARPANRSISNQTNKIKHSTRSGKPLVGFPTPGNCCESARFQAPHCARRHAGVLLLSAPMAAALAVPFVFAALLLVQGVTLVALAFRVRTREL